MSDDQPEAHADAQDDELRRRLAATDPARSLDPADADRVQRLLEATMSHDVPETARPAPATTRRWLTAAVAAAVLLVGGTVAAVTLPGGEGEGTLAVTAESTDVTEQTEGSGATEEAASVLALDAPVGVSGRCMVPTAESLARMDTALDGSVTQVSGDAVRIEVSQWYAGGGADVVELRNPEELAPLLGGVSDFEVGQRYLVSAVGGTVTVCGFTAPWSPERAELFEDAFGS
jgi:hypothetical protein